MDYGNTTLRRINLYGEEMVQYYQHKDSHMYQMPLGQQVVMEPFYGQANTCYGFLVEFIPVI